MSPKSFEAVWLRFCPDESRQEFCFPPRNIVEIPVKIALFLWPPRILPRFAKASRRDFGRREVASRRESRRDSRKDPGEILAAGIFASRRESRRDSRQDPGEILAAEIFASRRESRRDSRQDPGEILAAGNFASRRESCRDPAGIPAKRKIGGTPVEIAAGSRQDPGPYLTRETKLSTTKGLEGGNYYQKCKKLIPSDLGTPFHSVCL